MYEKLKAWYEKYQSEPFAKDYIRKAVVAGKISPAQYAEITHEAY